jgi:hypothetical protein
MSSKDVSGGIWRFLIGAIAFCVVAVIVFVGWLKEDISSRSAPASAPVAAVSAALTAPLPSIDVDATKIIGMSRPAIWKYLGKPGEKNREIEFFDIGDGITVEVQYHKGRGGQMTVTSTTAGTFHDSTRVQEWAHLPPLELTAPRNFAGVKDSRNSVQAVVINGKKCGVGLTDRELTVLTEEFEQAP